MKKTDIILSLVTGEGVALLFIWFFKKTAIEVAFLNWGLIVFFPILALIALWISYLIGKKFLVVYQLGKFLLIGALFALFDLVILNSLMGYFGITEGTDYSIFVAISFVVVTTIKYIADKFWAFEKKGREQAVTEFWKFFIVTLISGGIQIGVASLVVNIIGAPVDVSSLVWANIGKILGIIIASAWNFLGYKFVVFKI